MIRSTGNLFRSSLSMLNEVKHEIDTSEFMNCGLRVDVVFQCINVSVEHSLGVNSLMAADLPIPAMVVLRAQYEAVTRAYWLLYIATNNEVMKINFNWTNEEQWLSDKFPMITEMLEKLSKADLPAKGNIQHLVEFKKYHLKALNSFVHTGKHAFIRSSLGFDPSMIDTLMRQSNNLVSVAVHIMFKHSIPDKQHFLLGLHEKYKECFYVEQDVDPAMKATIDARFYTTKTPITAADLLNDKVLPFYAQHGLPMLRIITDRGTLAQQCCSCGKVEHHVLAPVRTDN